MQKSLQRTQNANFTTAVHITSTAVGQDVFSNDQKKGNKKRKENDVCEFQWTTCKLAKGVSKQTVKFTTIAGQRAKRVGESEHSSKAEHGDRRRRITNRAGRRQKCNDYFLSSRSKRCQIVAMPLSQTEPPLAIGTEKSTATQTRWPKPEKGRLSDGRSLREEGWNSKELSRGVN